MIGCLCWAHLGSFFFWPFDLGGRRCNRNRRADNKSIVKHYFLLTTDTIYHLIKMIVFFEWQNSTSYSSLLKRQQRSIYFRTTNLVLGGCCIFKLLKWTTDCMLDTEKLYIYHSHSRPQDQRQPAARQYKDLREDSGILWWFCAWNLTTTSQETFQIHGPWT